MGGCASRPKDSDCLPDLLPGDAPTSPHNNPAAQDLPTLNDGGEQNQKEEPAADDVSDQKLNADSTPPPLPAATAAEADAQAVPGEEAQPSNLDAAMADQTGAEVESTAVTTVVPQQKEDKIIETDNIVPSGI